jgi:hypothetical protein
MNMDLLLKKKSGGLLALLAKDYELMHKGSICGAFSFHNWKYVEFLIGQNQYTIRSEGKAKWLLEQRGVSIAFCQRHASGPKLEFTIEFDDRVWCFKPNRKKLVLGYDIWDEKLKIGRVTPHIKLWGWSEIGATFNQMPRLEIASFAIWLIGIHWVGIAGTLTATRAEIGI